jgi:hypothetical protein
LFLFCSVTCALCMLDIFLQRSTYQSTPQDRSELIEVVCVCGDSCQICTWPSESRVVSCVSDFLCVCRRAAGRRQIARRRQTVDWHLFSLVLCTRLFLSPDMIEEQKDVCFRLDLNINFIDLWRGRKKKSFGRVRTYMRDLACVAWRAQINSLSLSLCHKRDWISLGSLYMCVEWGDIRSAFCVLRDSTRLEA